MVFRKRNYRRKPRAKIVRRRQAASTKPSRTFTKKVMKVIHKVQETKCVTALQSSVQFNSGINAAGDMLALIPSMSQGTGNNTRVGDHCSAQYIDLRGYLALNLTYQNQAASRVAVRVMVVQPKVFTNLDAVTTYYAQWMPKLLNQGGTAIAFTGLVTDLYTPLNTDIVTKLYDKVFYMSVPAILNYAGTTDVDNYITSDNRASIKFFRHRFKLRNKILKYDANVSSNVNPVNYGPVVLVGYAHLDGSAPDVANTQVLYSHVSTLYYEDA